LQVKIQHAASINELDKCDLCSSDPLQGKNVHGTTNIFCFPCNNQSSTKKNFCQKYN
jgi:formylmethanofuran dehydrogenase subunit E